MKKSVGNYQTVKRTSMLFWNINLFHRNNQLGKSLERAIMNLPIKMKVGRQEHYGLICQLLSTTYRNKQRIMDEKHTIYQYRWYGTNFPEILKYILHICGFMQESIQNKILSKANSRESISEFQGKHF